MLHGDQTENGTTGYYYNAVSRSWVLTKPPHSITAMSLSLAIQQIEFARGYTLSLLADIDESDWFRLSDGCPTHIAWQVGHLAMAEYGLCLFRQRGRQEI